MQSHHLQNQVRKVQWSNTKEFWCIQIGMHLNVKWRYDISLTHKTFPNYYLPLMKVFLHVPFHNSVGISVSTLTVPTLAAINSSWATLLVVPFCYTTIPLENNGFVPQVETWLEPPWAASHSAGTQLIQATLKAGRWESRGCSGRREEDTRILNGFVDGSIDVLGCKLEKTWEGKGVGKGNITSWPTCLY